MGFEVGFEVWVFWLNFWGCGVGFGGGRKMATYESAVADALRRDDVEKLKATELFFGSEMTFKALEKGASCCLRWLLEQGVPMANGCYRLAIENGDEVFLREHLEEFPDGSLAIAYAVDNMTFFELLLKYASDEDVEDFVAFAKADTLRPHKKAKYLALVKRPERSLSRAVVIRAILEDKRLPLSRIGFRHCLLPKSVNDNHAGILGYYANRIKFLVDVYDHHSGCRVINGSRRRLVKRLRLGKV